MEAIVDGTTAPDPARPGRPGWLRRPNDLRVLAAAAAVGAVGDGAFHVTSAVYFTVVAGLTPAQVGAGLTMAWGLGFLLSAPMGALADRIGLRTAAVGWILMIAAALLAAATLDQPAVHVVIGVLIVYAVAQSGLGGVRQALVAAIVPSARRVSYRARLHVAINAGLATGAGLGGLALMVDTAAAYRITLLLDAVAFGLAAVTMSRLGRPHVQAGVSPVGASSMSAPGSKVPVLRDRPYLAVTVLTAALYLYMPLLTVVLPIFLTQQTVAPGWTVSIVFLVNTAGVLVMQVWAARRATDLAAARRLVRCAGAALGVSCALFAATATTGSERTAVALICAGALVQVIGEVMLAAGSWCAGFELADADRPGQWQSVFAAAQPLARAVGPVVLVTLVLGAPGVGWFLIAAIFVASGLLFSPVVRWGERALQPAPSTR